MNRPARLVGAGVLAALLALGTGASTAHAATREAQVKAAYLYKLAAFVHWPGADDGGFHICLVGREDVGASLAQIVRGQRVGNRPIAVDQIGRDDAARARGCQVLVLGSGPETARAMVAATAGQPVLTVTDRSGATRGGVIEFVIQDGRVRFAIDQRQAAARNLQLSSKLLAVAVGVES
jgi:hypothetical protein